MSQTQSLSWFTHPRNQAHEYPINFLVYYVAVFLHAAEGWDALEIIMMNASVNRGQKKIF